MSKHRNRKSLQLPPENEQLNDWAGKEIDLAIRAEKEVCKDSGDDWTYGVNCYKSALKAYRALIGDGQHGSSLSLTKGILNRLIDGRVLTPIEDTPDIWEELPEHQSKDDTIEKEYQCRRMGSLFKIVHKDGRVSYTDISRAVAVDIDKPDVSYRNTLVNQFVDAVFPIKMPYFPPSRKFKIFRESFKLNSEVKDFDTLAFLYVILPDGKKIPLNRYFKDVDGRMVVIEAEEYEERKKQKVK